jgi:ABC-type multidrug transport system fused ATPase/permease subunit
VEALKDNIAYAKKGATDEEVKNAAVMANVEEFVTHLDQRYETIIGENGASLSGGQKQRLAIARAVLKNPSILILDEATSALDTVSEHLVQQALDRLMEGKTTVIIAHRLSTIKNADMIVVLNEGRIVQQGKHDDLLQQEGIYKEMYFSQKKTVESI